MGGAQCGAIPPLTRKAEDHRVIFRAISSDVIRLRTFLERDGGCPLLVVVHTNHKTEEPQC